LQNVIKPTERLALSIRHSYGRCSCATLSRKPTLSWSDLEGVGFLDGLESMQRQPESMGFVETSVSAYSEDGKAGISNPKEDNSAAMAKTHIKSFMVQLPFV